jgi:tetratricopeptide (TPR) repeat protein
VDGVGSSSRVFLQPITPHISRHYPKLDRLSIVSLLSGKSRVCLPLFIFPLLCFASVAQAPHAGGRRLLHGSILTAQGRPVAEATVEIRDLHGIKVASGLTDDAGKFEISGAAEPGEYIFLVASVSQIKDEQVLLAQPDLELSLVLPPASATAPPQPGRYIVSAKRLGIPAKARSHLGAAHRHFAKMEFDEAEREIERALQADPAFAQAFAMRAFIKLAEKDPNGAAEDAKHAAALDADDAEVFVALAMAYNSLRRFQEAEDAAWHALSLRPESWQGGLELAKSLYGQREFVLALRELDLKRFDFPDVHLVRGNVLMSLERNHEASEEFATFLREAPTDPRAGQISGIVNAAR